MSEHVPEVLWFGFAVFAFVGMMGGLTWGGYLQHRQRMKALEILRLYAEKNVEPPAAILEPLAREIFETPEARAATAAARKASRHMARFFGEILAAAAAAGIAWWRMQAGGPDWLVYAAGIFAIIFVAGAIARLIATFVSREK